MLEEIVAAAEAPSRLTSAAVAEYLAEMLPEFRILAERANLKTLAYLIEMARLEAVATKRDNLSQPR